MFELQGTYANRRGKYTVMSINGPKMQVRYEDGTTAELNVEIQRRIWENIQAEEEARSSRQRAFRGRTTTPHIQFFIKPINLLAAEELTFPGWQERVAVSGDSSQEIRPGDRLLYYAIELQVFFAVATVTGASYEAGPRDSLAHQEGQVRFFPIDLDAHAHNLEKAVTLDSVELESVPNVRELLNQSDIYIQISEDDFELLAELLTEVTEEEEEDDEDDEDDEEDED